MKQKPTVGPMSRLMAAATVRGYVCSGCWSNLIIQPDKDNPQLDHVLCPNCDTPGYVTKRFAEEQSAKSLSDRITARNNLRDAMPFLNPQAGKQVQELLAELGF